MNAVAGVVVRMLGGLTVAAVSAIAVAAPHARALPPAGFPNLDAFTAVPAEGYLGAPAPGSSPRVSFSAGATVVCDFYGGPPPVPQPSQDIKCTGDMLGMDDMPFPGGRPRPGDCVVGSVGFKGPGYQLSRMSYAGCDGNPPPLPAGGKALGPGQKLTYLNVTCAVGADNLVACLDITSGDHGFVVQRSGSWAF